MEQLKIGEIKEKQTRIFSEGENVYPLYVFSGSIDETLYYDITSVNNWMTIAMSYYDYSFCRNQSKLFLDTTTWSALTQSDKISAASTFIVDKTLRNEVLTEEQQKSYWDSLVEFSYRSRERRWKSAKGYISYYLNVIDSSDMATATKELSDNYLLYNIQTISIDGVNGLFDWITSTNNYSGGNGFNSKSYWTQEHQDNLMKILKDGIY